MAAHHIRNICKYLTILVAICCCYPIPLHAQDESNKILDYKFKNLDFPLVNNRVQCILQDGQGFLWIGTLGGLQRFDGQSLVTYPASTDSTTLDADRVEALYEDSKKRLWVSTDEGIYQYSRELNNFTKISIEQDFLDAEDARLARTESIVEDSKGTVWISNERAGLQYYDEVAGCFKSFLKPEDNSAFFGSSVLSIAIDKSDNVWLGTYEHGVLKVNPQRGEINKCCEGIPEWHGIMEASLYILHVDKKNRLWVAMNGRGVAKVDLNKEDDKAVLYNHDPHDMNSLISNSTVNVTEDRSGKIWISNENGGLHLYNEKTDDFHRFVSNPSQPYSISNNSIKTLYEDAQGRLWVGTHLGGLDVYDKYLYNFEHHYRTENYSSINYDVVRSFIEDSKGNLWISTDGGGLNYFDRKSSTFKAYLNDPLDPQSISSNAVLGMDMDKFGRLWIGTWNGGLNRLNIETMKFEQISQNLPRVTKVFCVTIDSKDRVWVADQQGGVSLFDLEGRYLTNLAGDLKDPASFSVNNAVYIAEDAKNRIWVASEANGIGRIVQRDKNDYYIQRYQTNPIDSTMIPNAKINHLFTSRDGKFWIAGEGGLSQYQENSDNFRTYTKKHGLISTAIKSVTEDDHGNLWLGTSLGIVKFNPKLLEVKNYTSEDGLQEGEFSRYTVLRLKSGEFAFGGYNGFNIFHPDSITHNPNAPRLYFSGLNIFNEPMDVGFNNSPLYKSIEATSSISLNHRQSVFTIEYSGVSFTQPDRNQYAYRLRGLEDNWNYVGNRQEATYTNLDPGSYYFELKGANNDGVWTETPLTLEINIIPPWWKTSWFRLGLVLTGILLVIMIIRIRTQSLSRYKEKLTREVKQRTAEVRKLNKKLANSNEILVDQKKDLEMTIVALKEAESKLILSEKMASLGIFTAGIAHEINNPINFISGAKEKLFELIDQKLSDKSKEDKGIFNELKRIMDVGIKRTTDIVASLRNYSKNDTGTFESYNLIECLEESLVILSHRLSKSKIKLVKQVPESLVIDCMPGRISQVFINLIANALDVLDNNGTINIEIRADGDRALINVSDTGAGITDEEISRLFDPFYSTKEVGQGVGLGLYIVYGIIKDHNGRIETMSGSQGTNFQIQLPIHQLAQLKNNVDEQ